jgi:hypothetical protein
MPFKHEWYIQDHIIKVEFWGNLTVEDIANAFQILSKFLNESNAQRIHLIHDWSKLERFPISLTAILNAIDFNQRKILDKIGWVVIFGVQRQLIRMAGDLTFQLFQIHTHMADDLHSALEFLQDQEPSLKSILDQKAITDVTWYLQGHILHCYDVFTAEQTTLRNQNALRLVEAEGKAPAVHLLIDFSSTDIESYSADVRELVNRSTSTQAFQEARDNLIRHPLFGWVIVIAVHSRNIDVSGKIIAMKYNYKRKEVDTLDDAITFLKQIDPHIARLLTSQSDDT